MNKTQLRNLGKKGQVLILSYFIISAFLIFSAGLLFKAMSERSFAERQRLTAEAFYLAEGATENAINTFSFALANFVISPGINSYSVTTTYATKNNLAVTTTLTRLETTDRLIIENGTNIYACNYEVATTVTHPENSAISVTVHQIVARRLIPTFQHAVFYNNDLEILPGAAMTLSGKIHSNNDIYLDSDGSTLTINSSSLTSAGSIYNERKDSGLTKGTTLVSVYGSSPVTYEAMNGLDSSSTTWTTDATSRWGGTVQSSVHGITEQTTPSVGSIASSGYYATNANVVITDTTIVKNGTTLVEGVNYPKDTVTTTTSLYNNREGKYVRASVVNLSKLSGATGTCCSCAGPACASPASACPCACPTPVTCANNMPSNGLLYASRTDASPSQEPGIELTNGSTIGSSIGLTVVSNDPVYIKGDYNTVSSKPTSIIADSLNLLSNNWNDTNSTKVLSSRPATQTTFNCAFVAGIDTTTSGNYNGGLENYPRLHEGWSGINLNIVGSFVALWNSQIADGSWTYGSPYYTAPRRNWQYNTNFNNPANLPPFTPMAVEIRRVAWWKD